LSIIVMPQMMEAAGAIFGTGITYNFEVGNIAREGGAVKVIRKAGMVGARSIQAEVVKSVGLS